MPTLHIEACDTERRVGDNIFPKQCTLFLKVNTLDPAQVGFYTKVAILLNCSQQLRGASKSGKMYD